MTTVIIMQTVEISAKEWSSRRPRASSAKSAHTMAREAGRDLASTFARKFPRILSWLGSRARTKEGMPMTAVEMSDIWMGMKG